MQRTSPSGDNSCLTNFLQPQFSGLQPETARPEPRPPEFCLRPSQFADNAVSPMTGSPSHQHSIRDRIVLVANAGGLGIR